MFLLKTSPNTSFLMESIAVGYVEGGQGFMPSVRQGSFFFPLPYVFDTWQWRESNPAASQTQSDLFAIELSIRYTLCSRSIVRNFALRTDILGLIYIRLRACVYVEECERARVCVKGCV